MRGFRVPPIVGEILHVLSSRDGRFVGRRTPDKCYNAASANFFAKLPVWHRGGRLETRLIADIEEHLALFQELRRSMLGRVLETARLLSKALDGGGKILVAGNGGSAADAQHFVAELVGRYMKERRALAAIALTTDTSILTAVGNDYGFEQVFSRQVDGLGCVGDVLVAISTSGNSRNLIRALEVARRKQVRSIALLGKDGGAMKNLADELVLVPSFHTARIQEAHQWIWHSWCELIDRLDGEPATE